MERMRKMKKKNGLSQVVKIATVVWIIVLFLLVLRTRCIPQNVLNKFPNIVLGLDIILIILSAIGILLFLSVSGVWVINTFKSGFHNVRCCDDEMWDEIEGYKKRWSDNGDYYKKMIRVINHFYQKKGKVDKMVKRKEVDRLFLRLDFLNAQMNFENDLKSALQSLGISAVVSLMSGVVAGSYKNQVLIIIIEIISLLGFFLIIIVFYSWRGKFGSYDYLINQYEKKLLLKKIDKLNKVLSATLENEEALKAQQVVINALIAKCKKARKKDQEDIKKDIHIIESLQLDIGHKDELYVQTVKVGKNMIKLFYRKGGVNSCYNFEQLVNDQYKQMYKILEKYEWL